MSLIVIDLCLDAKRQADAAADAAEEVGDADALTAAVDRLLADPGICESRGRRGNIIAESENDVLDRVSDALAPYIFNAVAKRRSS